MLAGKAARDGCGEKHRTGRVWPPGNRFARALARVCRMILAARKKGAIRPEPFFVVNDPYPFSPAQPPLTPRPRGAYMP